MNPATTGSEAQWAPAELNTVSDQELMEKVLVAVMVLGGHVKVAELKYQHNKVRSKNTPSPL